MIEGVLVLDDGTFYRGVMPFAGRVGAEICFNTGMTGYQESITDPSFTKQIITFTFPYVGNVGANGEDMEGVDKPTASGIIVRNEITEDSNFRSEESLINFLKKRGIVAICGIDTRLIAGKIREKRVSNCIIASLEGGEGEIEKLIAEVKKIPSMNGMDLTREASAQKAYHYAKNPDSKRIVVVDYGVKENILRILANRGFDVWVVPYNASFADISALKPDGVLLSNGPGDPRETIKYTKEAIVGLIKAQIPIFGICLGHQILAILLGCKVEKLPQGHRGINQPVVNYDTGKIEITPQNHGFACMDEAIPAYVRVTHRSLFDSVIEGIEVVDGSTVKFGDETAEVRRVFAVQYHPEGSAGPHDSMYLFEKFFSYIV